MSQDDVKQSNWRDIAKQVSSETDPDKVAELVNDLIQALDDCSQKSLERLKPDSKGREKGAP